MEPEPEPESQERIFVPPDFYCPISGDLIQDPVSEPSGHTYERSEILKWLKISKTSPLTKEYLDISHLSDNIAMKRSIESIKHKLQEDQLQRDSQVSQEGLSVFKDNTSLISMNQYYNDDLLFLKINVPNVEVRPPIDLVLCIDVSYSMFDEATLKGDKNEKISHGMSVLSLTVTAAKTILNCLNENDNISIVTYSSEARTLVKHISCSPENKVVINMELDSLKPISNTNMWSGMIESLDILRTCSVPTKNKGIILLTDGIPNVEPPRGHEAMLERYFTEHNFKCMFSCYGFGYNLNSELLLNISNISGGDGYSFIPDASILGSVFIHGISNILTTAVYNPILKIQLSKNVKFQGGSDLIEIPIDSLKYGRSKNLQFNIDTKGCHGRSRNYLKDFAEVTLVFPDGREIKENTNSRLVKDYYIEQKYRIKIIDTINDCITLKKFNDEIYKTQLVDLIREIKATGVKTNYINNFLFDLEGQVKEALNMTSNGQREDWFSRWGIHYLRSLQEAYRKEICNNFKDKGVSNFRGEIFEKILDQVTEIFEKIPPPKPDIKKPTYTSRGGGHGGGRGTLTPLKSMASYNTQSGGCCSGDSKVYMSNKTYVKAEDIKKGDRVISYEFDDNNFIMDIDEIECVIKTNSDLIHMNLVKINDLTITPYHPIVHTHKREWVFPSSIKAPELIHCKSLYTFVTKERKSIIIEDFAFATLGHNLQGNIISHDYLGTDQVINDLKKFTEYESGLINLTPDMFKRNEHGNIVEISSC